MIPIKDENPTQRFPAVTLILIIACVVIYFFVQHGQIEFFASSSLSERNERELDALEFNLEYAAIPCELTEGRPLTEQEVGETFIVGDQEACSDQPAGDEVFPDKNVWLAVLASMFLHGGLLHLGGNMLFLWIFGNNIEDHLGAVKFLLFYAAAGIIATLAHVAVQPDSTVPVVGASGAIAGVMGAYLVWFPNAPIRTVIIYFLILIRDIQAKWVLGFWLVLQFFTNPNEGVAWVAHVGGFVFGVLVGLIVRASRPARHAMWRYDQDRDLGSFRASDDWRS